MAPAPLSTGFVTPSATHHQTWGRFPSGWACAHSRPLWVSPMTCPVRLGVPPAAAPTPMGVFNQRFEAFFPCPGALGYAVCFAPRCLTGLSVRKCGAQGLLVVRLSTLFIPHSASLSPATAT